MDETKALLQRVQERFRHCRTVEKDNRDAAEKDIDFAFGRDSQWDEKLRKQREDEQRPVLEFNQCPQFVRSISNDARQNKPAIKVRPADDKADDKTADVFAGLIRAIENDSNAQQIYVTAHEHAVAGGFAFWRIVTEYEAPNSFLQKLVIKPVKNHFAAYLDPDHAEPDGCDAMYGFVCDTMPIAEFKRKWPKAEAVNFESEEMRDWTFDSEHVVIADYYERTYEKRELIQLTNGQTAWRDEIEKDPAKVPAGVQIAMGADGKPVVRTAEVPRVRWYKVTGAAKLEEFEWAGEYIPLVELLGEATVIRGERVLKGLIANAKDAQKMYNYMMTTGAELTGLSPKAPWVGAVGSFETDPNWTTANSVSHPYLEYDQVQGAPPPQRTNNATGAAELIGAAQAYKQDLKSTIGVYDPSLGNKSNETSGRAIMAREAQGDAVTYHFRDNLAMAIRYTGRILVDLIPKIYDSQRLVRLMNEDGKEEAVTINRPIIGPEGVSKVENNLRSGRYEVIVDVGPSFQTRRMESAQSMTEFLQVIGPQAAPLIADKIARNMDWPNADEVADRLGAMLPPQIQQMEAQQGMEGVPPAVMQQIAGMQQQMQQAMQQMQQMQAMGQQMQQALAAKDQELAALKASKDNELRKAALEARKLDIEEQRLGIEAQRMQQEATQPPMLSAPTGPEEMPEREEGGESQLAASVVQLSQAVMAMLQTVSAPRKTVIEYDGQGNPVASVSVPVTVQ